MNNKIDNFDESDLQKDNSRVQGKEYETETITSRLSNIGEKLQPWTKTAPPQGFNIAPDKDPSIKSGLAHKSSKDEDASLLVRTSLDLDPPGEYISLLGEKASLTDGDIYSPGYASL